MSRFPTPATDVPDTGIGPARRPVSEARRAHLRAAGRKGNAQRRVLSGADAEALGVAYGILERIADKYGIGQRAGDPCVGHPDAPRDTGAGEPVDSSYARHGPGEAA